MFSGRNDPAARMSLELPANIGSRKLPAELLSLFPNRSDEPWFLCRDGRYNSRDHPALRISAELPADIRNREFPAKLVALLLDRFQITGRFWEVFSRETPWPRNLPANVGRDALSLDEAIRAPVSKLFKPTGRGKRRGNEQGRDGKLLPYRPIERPSRSVPEDAN